MEIKAILKRPYSNEERMKFVVTNNHQHGYEIKETEVALEAWGKTAEEQAAEKQETDKKAHIQKLQSDMLALDTQSVRPLRALSAGVGTEEDKTKLEEIETKIAALRKELQELTSPEEQSGEEAAA